MSIDPVVTFIVALVVAVVLYRRWRARQDEFPPLQTAPDDPLMLEALAKAKASLPEFLARLQQAKDSALVKLRFVSSSNDVEHLWANVLSLVSEQELAVQLVTTPVTHTGALDPIRRCRLEDIEDWQVRDAAGKVHGAFTQRAMFAIARRDGVKLPKQLREIEHEYR
jgi:uncharacterized protein YegJ (DUF2314 family)